MFPLVYFQIWQFLNQKCTDTSENGFKICKITKYKQKYLVPHVKLLLNLKFQNQNFEQTIWLRTDIELGLIRVHHILLLEIRQESRLQIYSVVIVECCWTLLNGVETVLIICSQRAASGCIKRFFEGIDLKTFSLWFTFH